MFIHIILLFKRVRKSIPEDVWFSRPATILLGLFFVQIAIGIYTWQRPDGAGCHGACGGGSAYFSDVVRH